MGWWFGKKAMAPTRPFIPAWLTGEGEPSGIVRGYEAQLDEAFRRNPVGLRSVRLVAGLVGALPLFSAEGDAKALTLAKAGGLMERAAASLLLHGNAYVRLVVDGYDQPAELHLMRPERVSVVSGTDGWPSAYLYRVGGQGTRITKQDALGRQQVAHLKSFDPSDDHYDPDRDYQTGQMRASSGGYGTQDQRVELLAVLTADEAKLLAEGVLARRWRAGDKLRLQLPPRRMALRPGDAIQLAGSARRWIIQNTAIEGFAVAIEAASAPATSQSLPADPGRIVSQPDLIVGRSELALFELPADGDELAQAPRAYVAASNAGLWKRLAVELILGPDAMPGIALTRRAIVGQTETALHARAPMTLDELSDVTVQLTNCYSTRMPMRSWPGPISRWLARN